MVQSEVLSKRMQKAAAVRLFNAKRGAKEQMTMTLNTALREVVVDIRDWNG